MAKTITPNIDETPTPETEAEVTPTEAETETEPTPSISLDALYELEDKHLLALAQTRHLIRGETKDDSKPTIRPHKDEAGKDFLLRVINSPEKKIVKIRSLIRAGLTSSEVSQALGDDSKSIASTAQTFAEIIRYEFGLPYFAKCHLTWPDGAVWPSLNEKPSRAARAASSGYVPVSFDIELIHPVDSNLWYLKITSEWGNLTGIELKGIKDSETADKIVAACNELAKLSPAEILSAGEVAFDAEADERIRAYAANRMVGIVDQIKALRTKAKKAETEAKTKSEKEAADAAALEALRKQTAEKEEAEKSA